jgi:hypothetical protein
MPTTTRKGKRVPVSSAHPAPEGTASSTRTSSRSAKRRSPKTPPIDPEVLEVERVEFLRAMDRYKRKTGKTFPSWSEVLEVLRSIGWSSPARLNGMHPNLPV